MKKILVTGADGQLGMTLREIAKDYPNLSFDFKSSEQLDIANAQNIAKVFQKTVYDYCINCAAYTNVEKAQKEPEKAYAVNAEGVKKLALCCKKRGAILIHISTDYVFDGKKTTPYYPNDDPNPINEYGKSKWLGEQHILNSYKKSYIVRTSWLYSKKHGKNFYRTILHKVKEKEQLKIIDTQKGCPTDTISLARFLIDEIILANKDFGIYHFTDGVAMTWYDFAKRILQENGFSTEVLEKLKNQDFHAKRPKNSVLNNTFVSFETIEKQT